MTIPCRLRVAAPQDASSLGHLLEVSYGTLMTDQYAPETLSRALPLITRANPKLLDCGTYYVVENQNGVFVGCGGWTTDRPGTGDVVPGLAHIRHFATHPSHLACGIGRMIFTHCIAEAKKIEIKKLLCYSSLNAVPFYEALGFRSLRPLEIPMGPALSFPAIEMDIHI